MAAQDRVLAIDSTWDDNTALATVFRNEHVHQYLKQHGFPVKELSGKEANKQRAQQEATAKEITFITGVSHGTGDSFTGDQDRPVFETGDYDPKTVKGKIIHFLSCNTALFLGRNMVEPSGATAYFGYTGPFAWPDEGGSEYADIFFGCDAEIDRALAEGADAGHAGDRAVAKFNEQIRILRNKGDVASIHAAAILEEQGYVARSKYRPRVRED